MVDAIGTNKYTYGASHANFIKKQRVCYEGRTSFRSHFTDVLRVLRLQTGGSYHIGILALIRPLTRTANGLRFWTDKLSAANGWLTLP